MTEPTVGEQIAAKLNKLPAEDKPGIGAVPGGATPTPDAPPATWEAIFEHPRFKELTKRAKEAEGKIEAAEAARQAAEQAELLKRQEFQTLYEQEKARADELHGKLTAAEQTARRKDNLRALMDAANKQQPPWAPEAVQNLARFVEQEALDGELDAKAAEAQIKAIAAAHPYVLKPQRADAGSPALRAGITGQPKPQPSGRPLTL